MFDPRNVALPVLLAAAALSLVASCSASPSQEAVEGEGTAVTQAISGPQLCPVTSSAIVLASAQSVAAACAPVPGRGGTWTAAHITACTPVVDTGSDAVLCSYGWTPNAAELPDLAALQALSDVYVASLGNGGDEACTAAAMLRFEAILHFAGVRCPVKAGGGPNAPKGCDVCRKGMQPGVMMDQLVIPRSTPLSTLLVEMSNGTKQIVTLDAASTSARSSGRRRYIDVPLPTPPRGVHYVDGPAYGYGYNSPSP